MFKSKRILGLFLTLMFISTSITYLSVPKAFAYSSIPRLAGTDRYETAIKISQQGWSKSENVVIATGEDFPDALCAAPLAKQLDAPILLAEKAGLRGTIESEIDRLGAENVFIIGGEGVVSKSIKLKLESKGLSVVRLFGDDRYKTSVSVANYISDNFKKVTEVMIATGQNFPDALSAAPIAASQGMPILLTDKVLLPDSVSTYLKNRGINKSYIIGGTGVIGSKVLAGLSGAERIWGRDRYETNAEVLGRFKDVLNFESMYIATGNNFPDALAGSALAPKSSSPVVLTDVIPTEPTRNLIGSKYTLINNMYALGGTGVVTDNTLQIILKSNINAEGNSLANINNFGLASVQGGFIYYSNYSDNQNLYKMKADGSSNTKLNSDGGVSHINVLGDWIYYSGNDGKLYRMKVDGSQKSIFINEEVYFSYVTADFIYFYSNGSLNRMKLDGSARTSIIASADQWNYYISGGFVYYIDNGKLLKVKTDGTQNTTIINGDVDQLAVSGNNIYFVNYEQKLYKTGLDGKVKVQITDDKVRNINLSGNWIYYINASDESNVYKVALDGTFRTRVGNLSVYDSINIVGDNIFCANVILNSTIYRMASDGSGKIKIGSGMAGSFKFINDRVYYVDISDSNKIKSMKTDGAELSSMNASSSSEIEAYEGYIYYSNQNDNNKLYKIKNDNTQNQKVLDDSVGNIKIWGDFIYYSNISDMNKLYKVKIDGTGKIKLSDKQSRNILVDSDWVYFFNDGVTIMNDDGDEVPSNYGIYKIKTDGSLQSEFKPEYIDTMFISNGYLIYHSLYDNGDDDIIRVKLDGTDSSVVANNAAAYTVDGDYICKLDRDNPTVISKFDKNGTSVQNYNISEAGFYVTLNSGMIYFETLQRELKLYNISTYGIGEKNF